MSLEKHFRTPPQAPAEDDGAPTSSLMGYLPKQDFGAADLIGAGIAGVAILAAAIWVMSMKRSQPKAPPRAGYAPASSGAAVDAKRVEAD